MAKKAPGPVSNSPNGNPTGNLSNPNQKGNPPLGGSLFCIGVLKQR
jgi:hypothetical protein